MKTERIEVRSPDAKGGNSRNKMDLDKTHVAMVSRK